MSGKSGTSRTQRIGLGAFIIIAFAIALILGIFISPFASESPDGLERVAEDKGFMQKAEEAKQAWKHSPIPDYKFPKIKSARVATGLSGLVGIIITVAVAVAVGLIPFAIRKLEKRSGTISADET